MEENVDLLDDCAVCLGLSELSKKLANFYGYLVECYSIRSHSTFVHFNFLHAHLWSGQAGVTLAPLNACA
jgi:hypothetical protein